jgi:hypothetical protein
VTVSTIGSVAEFDTNGVTTNYPFYFKFLANEDLVVTYVDPLGVSSLLNLGTHYTVNDAGNDQGGSIVTTSALAGPGQLIVSREMEAFQQTSLRNQGKFLAETHEDVFDKLTMLVQQGFAIFRRALTRPFGRDYFFAENRRITNVKDPVEKQDAATRGWSVSFFTGLVDQVSGVINTTTGIFYDGATLFDYLRFGVARSVPSVAAVRALLSSRNQRAFALGYYANGDGGGGEYYVDPSDTTSVDNGGSILVGADGARWKMKICAPLSVRQFGAKGAGLSFDDTAAIQACGNVCTQSNRKMIVPPVPAGQFYNVSGSGFQFDQSLVVEGDVGGMVNVYSGLQLGGSIIKYTGNSDLFAFDTVQDPTKRGIEGTMLRNLILLGTSAGKSAYRVGKTTDVGDVTKVKSNVGMENVYIGDFKSGRGYNINWCFSNTFTNVVIQNCGCTGSAYYAHGTRFIGGNQEQSLVGPDIRISYGVAFYGTVLQGFDQTRQSTFGLSVPSDFFIWSGWDGTGTTGASRTTPAGYAGVALRNLGSKVDLYGNYWEYNNYNVLTESDSHTSFHGGIVGLDSITKSFIQVGIGAVKCNDMEFQGGSHAGLQGVFQTERNYMAPCDIGETNNYASSIPQNKIFTGPQNHVGKTARYNPSGFEVVRHEYNTFTTDGQVILPNSGGAAGNFDLFPYATSNKLRHLYPTATTINYTFVDTNSLKALAGARLQLHVLVLGAGSSTITFSGTYFRVSAGSYVMPAGNQTIFEFEFSNGFWIMKSVPVVTAI